MCKNGCKWDENLATLSEATVNTPLNNNANYCLKYHGLKNLPLRRRHIQVRADQDGLGLNEQHRVRKIETLSMENREPELDECNCASELTRGFRHSKLNVK